jgi:putative radical SAM enzyme (TIGR03279 family)
VKKHTHKITGIADDSIAAELGIEAGDTLVKVNGKYVQDVFDFRFMINDEYVELLIKKPDGEEWEFSIEKEYNEDLGIIFEEPLMDAYSSCCNKCIFCFIDQMPPGMRDTLYFKDDDARLSFLQGNYITLTNMKDVDFERIINYHLSPINISVHTTNTKLRCHMLNNRFAGNILERLDRLYNAGVTMNSQIVLCKGYNDGEELENTIHDLTKYIPHMESLSVVPVGLTDYRKGLKELVPFEKEDAKKVLSSIHKWQNICLEHFGTRFVYASDEWYILAGLPLPDSESYEGFGQLENGVGMIRSFSDDFYAELNKPDNRKAICGLLEKKPSFTFVTGILFSDYLCGCLNDFKEVFPYFDYEVIPIVNDFFGHKITVAGLLTGRDIIAQLKDRQLMDYVVLPDSLLRSGEDVLLDDIHLRDIEKALQKDIHIVKSNGESLVRLVKNIVFNIQNEV